MAAQSTLKNMALCLTLVCLICSAVLAGAYAVTKNPIDAAAEAKTAKSIAEVLPEFQGTPELKTATVDGTEYQYYVTETGCAVLVNENGFGGNLKLMVGIANDGTICNTVVLEQSETPGLGAKCVNPDFSGQFKGFDPKTKNLLVKKDGGDVDAITAATITSRAYTKAVAGAVKVFDSANENANEGGSENE